jgi:hypothetical protein
MWSKVVARFLSVGFVSMVGGGCFHPPMANMQSARTVVGSQVRIAPYYSAIDQDIDDAASGESEGRDADEFGMLLGIGAGDGTEFQLRYDRFEQAQDGDGGYNFTSLGLKMAAVKNVLAFTVPLGFYWGDDISTLETLEIDPSVIATLPLGDRFEATGAVRAIVPVNPDLVQRIVVNLGFSLSTDVSRWAIMPEVGYSVDVDDSDSDPFISYGLALVFFTPQEK